jgi:dTDP-4-dehydrorhamnose reductase
VKNILILGSTGMLGEAIKKHLTDQDYEIFFTTRNKNDFKNKNEICFDFEKNLLKDLFKDLPNVSYVINCIGAIPQKYDIDSEIGIRKMIELNTALPAALENESKTRGFKIITIGTDCVFSGAAGRYVENSSHDSSELYGLSKSLGEKLTPSAMILRCSIIGDHDESNGSLHNWLLSQTSSTSIRGFANHYWNGITTHAFARLIDGIIAGGLFQPGTQHISPADEISKYELLKMIARSKSRNDLAIESYDHPLPMNRTLSSNYPERNKLIWSQGGYDGIPSISDLVTEMVRLTERYMK